MALRHRLRSHAYLALTLVLAGVFVVLAVRGVDWWEMARTLRAVRPAHLGAAFALVTLSFAVRGQRWGTLLSAECTLPPSTLFWATSLGYLGNYFLPARAGELVRSLALARQTGINTGYVLATALTERLFDALALVIISALALSSMGHMPEALIVATRTMAVIGLFGVLIVLAAPHLEDPVDRVIRWLRLPPRLYDRLRTLVAQFLLGMRACRHLRRMFVFTVMTVLVWTIDTLMAIQIGHAFGLLLSPAESILLLAALGLSSAIPSTPGYIGVYQFVAVLVMTRYSYSRHEALSYILIFQAISYLAALLYGLTGMWRLNARQVLTASARAPVDQSGDVPANPLD